MNISTSDNSAQENGNRRRSRWLVAIWATLACVNLLLLLDGSGQTSWIGLCLSLGMLCFESQQFVQRKPMRYRLALMASIFIAGGAALIVLHFLK